MQTNFAFLKSDPQFDLFADMAANAQKVLAIDPAICATTCRTALEFAVKWLYSVEQGLALPYDDRLSTLLYTEDFRDLLPDGLFPKIEYLRKLGNRASHNPRGITRDQAVLALENLHSFLDFVAYCYSTEYHASPFDRSLLDVEFRSVITPEAPQKLVLERLVEQNQSLKPEYTTRREKALEHDYVVNPMDLTEKATRKAYIDVMLTDAGWRKGSNWVDEYPIGEMPNKSGEGYADYVLFGDDGIPLAVVEAKRTSRNVEEGRQQAKLYADYLEKEFKRRPVVFLTNGYQTRLVDNQYPERVVSGIYSKRDLEKLFNLQRERKPLTGVSIRDEISNRYYQKEAIQSVCDAFERNRRKTLLVMATGSGKTRTVISLVDVLIRQGWVRNVLFLADRNALVTQAKRAFHNMLPNLSLCNLVEEKDATGARVVFSTYQTMMHCIDDTTDKQGDKLFTPGHFDLMVVDEAHRSIYNKYKDIFTYFDSLLVGLTATPKEDVGKTTYGEFDLQNGVPTYGYELAQAVEDGYLVDFQSVETSIKYMVEGIKYEELSPEEQEEYERTFAGEDGRVPAAIDSSALNEWLFNEDTIRKALHVLVEHGLKVDYGSKLGKTIIFAKNHRHAEKIKEIWEKEYPQHPDFCQVIDNTIGYSQSLIDQFSKPAAFPQNIVSVDMLDIGIDVPEILNLVFFKKVLSKAKFWQMIGRGTRLCQGVLDGEDKTEFYIFDLCSNFEFFRMNAKGKEAATTISLPQRLFNTKVEILYKLLEPAYQTDEFADFRDQLRSEVLSKINALNRSNFAVKLHLQVIDKFSARESWNTLTYPDTQVIAEHVAPLIAPDDEHLSATRFDMLLYQIELAILAQKTYTKARNDLQKKAQQLLALDYPQVKAQKELLERITHTDYLQRIGTLTFEEIREKLRELIKFIPPRERNRYDTDFTDDILSVEWNESQLENDDLANYKRKVSHYIKQHQHLQAIDRLKHNQPITQEDLEQLESILWGELGTQEQYEQEYGETPLGELVRMIVGLDREAANEAFSEFLSNHQLSSQQMHFVGLVVDYIVKNGMMKDLRVLQQSPFNNFGSVVELFQDTTVFIRLRSIIDSINKNAVA